MTGRPVPAAVVELMPHHVTVLSDREGRFTVRERGEHGVEAEAMGYHTFVGSVSMAADTNEVTIRLPADPVQLAGVTATVSRIESRRRAVPYAVRALDLEQIAASGAPDVYTLVRERLGVSFVPCFRAVSNTCVYARGRAEPAYVVVDEMWVPDAFVLTLYSPADVAAVESFQNGREIRVYTRWFVERVAKDRRMLLPVYLPG